MPGIVDRLSPALEGRYRIERELGAGGMALVFLAHDVRHDRPVALKLLRPELSAILGAERFLAEIRTTANLQHPHILPLHDSGEADGLVYYVMPYVEGESLRDRLNREKQLPVEEAVRLAREVASALAYAHRQGIIHRDIKPENILLHDWQALVADFGIALAASRSDGSTRLTETGMSLGTPQYMAPEQAMGEREITAKADLYALGCMLYEMLVGEPPFVGPTPQAIVARLVTEQPRGLVIQRPTVPPHVEAATLRALQKLPANRFESAKAFADALANPAFTVAGPATRPPVTASADWRQRSAVAFLLLAVVAAGLAAAAWLRPAPPRTGWQLVINMPRLSRLGVPVLSPRGDRLAFVGDGKLWVRPLGDLVARALDGTNDALSPFWSPDGESIAYFVGNRVFAVSADGGTPRLVTTMDRACALEVVCGGAWTDDGRLLLSSGFAGVQVAPARGGPAAPYLTPGPGEHFHGVAALPGGRGALVVVDPEEGSERIDVWDGTRRRTLVEDALLLQVVEPGYLLYQRSRGIWAVRLNGSQLDARDSARLLVDRSPYASAAANGVLVFVRPGSAAQDLVWVDRTGAIRGTVTSDDGVARSPALSPDERRIAFAGRRGIRIHAPEQGVRAALGGPDDLQTDPQWDPSGSTLFYTSARPGSNDQDHLLVRSVRLGSGAPVTVVDTGFDAAITRDGRYLTYTTGDVSRQDLWFRDLRAPNAAPQPFLVGPEHAGALRVSPDGRFAAFVAGDWTTGMFEVHLSRFPSGEDRTQVSTGGVRYFTDVLWSATGHRLYYVRDADGSLMEVDVTLGDQFRLSAPRVLFSESATGVELAAGFTMGRDPERFLAVRRMIPHGGEERAVVLLDGWLDRVKEVARR